MFWYFFFSYKKWKRISNSFNWYERKEVIFIDEVTWKEES